MADGGFIEVVDWNKHQHYKQRTPPWIKVYREVLTDYEITFNLEPWERWCLIGLWLLAAETDNRIPADVDWLRARLTIGRDPPLSKLQTLGFITLGDSASKMLDLARSREAETETEAETEGSTSLTVGTPVGVGRNGDDAAKWMHEVWMEELGHESHPARLTNTRRVKYRAMYSEQLEGTPDPKLAWRAVLRAVKRSDHHMSNRSYQMPESILRNEERRDTWVERTVAMIEKAHTKSRAAQSFADYYRERRGA